LRKPKILILSSEFPPGPGGIGQHAYSMADSLAERDYDLKVVTVSDYSSASECMNFDSNIKHFGIIRFKRYRSLLNQLFRFWVLIKKIHSFKPAITIHTGRFPLMVNALLHWFLKINKIKTIAVIHGSEINPKSKIQKILNQRGIRKADFVVSVSDYTQSLIPGNLLKHGSYNIIGNGITKIMQKNWDNYLRLREKPNNVLRLLTVGNVIPRKGQHNVINAIPTIKQKYNNVIYDVVGMRRYPELADKQLMQNNVAENVIFHGRIQKHADLNAFYNEANIFMLLSENIDDGDVEGFGIAALEANYFGVPVIGSKNTGVEAAVKDGFSGILVDAQNPLEIAMAIEKIMENQEWFFENSKKWARSNHWDLLVEKYIEVIDNL
jgi:phosphatidylinositol alpha-1,6-mannosyltransferase